MDTGPCRYLLANNYSMALLSTFGEGEVQSPTSSRFSVTVAIMVTEIIAESTSHSSKNAVQVAEIIGVSARTIRRWAEHHEISHLRCGKQLFFSDQDVSDFLMKARIPATR